MSGRSGATSHPGKPSLLLASNRTWKKGRSSRGRPFAHSWLLVGGYADIALRDFGLLIGAVALARLASAYPGQAASERRLR